VRFETKTITPERKTKMSNLPVAIVLRGKDGDVAAVQRLEREPDVVSR
jgi:hypothetical protein